MQFESSANSTQLVIVVGRGYAEHGHDLFTDRLVHHAAVPSHGINGHVAYLRHEAMRVDWCHAFHQAAVVRDDRDEHRRMTALGDRTRVWRLRFATRRKSHQIGREDRDRGIAVLR